MHVGPLVYKLLNTALPSGILSAMWLSVLVADGTPSSAGEFWLEAFRAFIVITTTLTAMLVLLLYRVWRERILKLEKYTQDSDKWFEGTEKNYTSLAQRLDRRQRMMIELLGVIAFGIRLDPKLEQQAQQLLYELRREELP